MVMTAGQNITGEDAAGSHSDNPLSAVVARHGSYDNYSIECVDDLSKDPVAQAYSLGGVPYPRVTISFNTDEPTKQQRHDESVVIDKGNIAIITVQVGFDANPIQQLVTCLKLRGLNK